jgi:hypothetical protein
LLALVVLATGVYAQERNGNIRGAVKDPSGAVLPDTAVTVTNKSTGRTYTTRTGSEGEYTAPELEPGHYSVRFEKTGFARFEVPEVQVLLGRTAVVDGNLQIGDVQQSVQVTEAAPVVDPTSTLIAHNVTSDEFDRLPKGRTFQSLVVTAPSVNTGVIEGGFQINGASGAENNYYIDGVSVNSVLDGRARQDAIFEYLQEVQVKTSGLEAEYGGALGGVVAAVTKSGGNDFHGELHWYNYGSHFNAGPPRRLQLSQVNFIDMAYIQDREAESKTNEFGGSLGGYFIKNRLWFFTSVSPRWYSAEREYVFDNGRSPETIERKRFNMNMFNKLSFDPTQRVRMNFSWIYTPSHMRGSWLAYNGMDSNWHTTSLATAQSWKQLGYFQPEQSYSGEINLTLTPTSLLNIRGGRYYLNYKDTGVPGGNYVRWAASSTNMTNIPANLQQPSGFSTPNTAQVFFDITTRTYVQADFSKYLNVGGSHNLKAGIGVTKNVNRVNDSWYGANGRVDLFWDSPLNGQRGTYGYYAVHHGGTQGSTGGAISHMYFQDSWRIHQRLTLNVGVRLERETVPSFQRDVQDYAFRFGWGDKVAPRLGASFDVLGDGRVKLFGSWGRYYDWTKYELARGTFGGEFWHEYQRTLDTLDVYNINVNNMPGRNLAPGPFVDWRHPGFEYLDPDVKPMSSEIMNAGVEWEIRPRTVFSARWVRNHLIRTIEDFSALDAEGNEIYRYGNPGEGLYEFYPSSSATCPEEQNGVCVFPFPKAQRDYNALELQISKRFSAGWLANFSYVYSKLYGNYSGLQNTDEIRPFTAFGASQQFAGDNFRGGGNANRVFDIDQAMFDAQGNLGLYGRLPTDRPHVFKLYGSKQFGFGTEIGLFARAMSGTPINSVVWSRNNIPIMVNGRGDMGRTPFVTNTDLLLAHELKFGEVKRLRFEFNALNVFNQKTEMFRYDRVNFEEFYRTSGIPVVDLDFYKGIPWQTRLGQVADATTARGARDPRYGLGAIFNPGFEGRFLVKFVF